MALPLTVYPDRPLAVARRGPAGVNLPPRLLDTWISRYAAPSLAAPDPVSRRKPAVVVTGASHRIGLAIARRFAKAGCDVALLARGARALQEAAAAIEE